MVTHGGVIAFEGQLPTDNGPVSVRLTLKNSEITQFPQIEIIDRPEFLQGGVAHIDQRNIVCIGNDGLSYLPRHNPAGAILGCLDTAQAILNQDETALSSDAVQIEFLRYWDGKQLLIDLTDEVQTVGSAYLCQISAGGKDVDVVSDNIEYLKHRYKTAIIGRPKRSSICLLDTEQPLIPNVDGIWPVARLNHVFEWLRDRNPALNAALVEALNQRYTEPGVIALVVVRAPNAVFGFKFSVPISGIRRGIGIGTFLRDHDSLSGQLPVYRYNCACLDNKSIVERNLRRGEISLAGKNIMLVGCGAVGGFLAASLVKLGAGTGGGRLKLVDHDRLGPGNIGRHYLGFKSLNEPKSDAMARSLREQLPGVDILSCAERIEDLASLEGDDLYIDATGHEGVSLFLSEAQLTGKIPAVLYVWVTNNGIAARGFLQEGDGSACINCVSDSSGFEGYSPQSARERVELGPASECDSVYVRFDVSAPQIASGIGTRLALDWASGVRAARMRTMVLQAGEGRLIRDKTPKRARACPYHG